MSIDPQNPTLQARITPARVTFVLAALVLLFAAAHAAIHLISRLLDLSPVEMGHAYLLFDLGTEANLPSYFSALTLLLAAALLALIARYESARRSTLRWHWRLLAAGFLLMSIDEAAQIHEFAGSIVTDLAGRGEGILFYSWYKLYIPLVILIGLFFIHFLRHLPLRHTLRFAVAGGLFLGGALGVEIIEAYLVSRNLPGRHVTRLFEETLEMSSVVLFVHALLLYIQELHIAVQISLSPLPDPLRLAPAETVGPAPIASIPQSTPPHAPEHRHSA